MPRFLMGLFIFGLAVYAVSDVIASTDQRRNNTPKFMWIIITLCIPILGPIIWIVFSNANKQGPSSNGRFMRRFPTTPKGPVAPDDDPDFLWRLQAEQRRAEQRKSQQTGGSDSSTNSKDTRAGRAKGADSSSSEDASNGPDSSDDDVQSEER